MDRTGEAQARLQLPLPFILFFGVPRNADVDVRVHGHRNEFSELYTLDYGIRPVAFLVPPTGVAGVSAWQTRMPQALIHLNVGGPVAPGPREDEYAYQYVWTAFAPAVQGTVVPHGKTHHSTQIPVVGTGAGDDLPALRFRWRGATAQTAWNTGVPGTGIAGPYTLDLSNAGAFATPIVPGTVRIVAPWAGGNCIARDWPWPTAVERSTCTTGRLIGDVDPTVDSTINYESGAVVVTFSQNIAVAPNISADFEHDTRRQPVDVNLVYDLHSI